MHNYIQLSIAAAEAEQEILISQLAELGATGFEQTTTHLNAYFDEANFLSYDVNKLLEGKSVELVTLPEKNWNEEWEQNFQPVVVADFCAVRASFHAPVTHVKHEIIITPKMSFGTGHHATTHMMIAQMAEIDFNNKQVLDFGTGTGILAILAEKLGAHSVIALDNDAWSFENAKENTAINNCKAIELQLSEQLPQNNSFDVVLANINKNVILDYLPQLRTLVKKGGVILFSGLLASDKEDIVKATSALNWKLDMAREMNNWIALLFVDPE